MDSLSGLLYSHFGWKKVRSESRLPSCIAWIMVVWYLISPINDGAAPRGKVRAFVIVIT